ncbi:MAG: enolase C-terminal domain-like protein, partial [Patescibacteria group bacterium]
LPLAAPFIADAKVDSVADVKKIMAKIEANLAHNSGLKTGIESALLDILGQAKKQPIYKLLGGQAKPFVVLQKTFSFEETRRDLAPIIKSALKQGVKIFKFKVGGEEAREIKALQKICKQFPGINIVLDANQAWLEPAGALKFLWALKNVKIKWLEQPLAAKDYDGLAALRRQTKTPIMADESCHNLHDLKLLREKKAIDLVNIKLAKCGGLLAAQAMIKYCQQNKIGCMLGDMLHSGVGTAYNLHAACLGNFISYDLTLHARLKADKTRGLKWDGFKVFIPAQPGLGVKL